MRNEHLADMQMIDRIMYSQQRALDQLRLESEELYQEAIQVKNSQTNLLFDINTSYNLIFFSLISLCCHSSQKDRITRRR